MSAGLLSGFPDGVPVDGLIECMFSTRAKIPSFFKESWARSAWVTLAPVARMARSEPSLKTGPADDEILCVSIDRLDVPEPMYTGPLTAAAARTARCPRRVSRTEDGHARNQPEKARSSTA